MRLGVLILFLVIVLDVRADIHDPLDPFERKSQSLSEPDQDSEKSASELILEAALLLDDDRPLDARSKLLKALQKDPLEYEAHIMLSNYYMAHVGHFKLALKYIKQAEALFKAKYGEPPYEGFLAQLDHERLLYLLAQARLNLDDYSGSLEALDYFTSLGYTSEWYPGTRSWVLMKLGRLDDAISVARLGVFAGAEPGRTLNMLGILLSMRGEREQSIEIFKEAIKYELTLGRQGQPSTPLNNIGEVYKEIFQEDKAESSFLRAVSLPDGCEHVLPSLNLALLYVDQLNFRGAKRAIDGFEACIAQFPLRNGEEHRALVHFVRGRIDLHTGRIDSAISHFEAARAGTQWFGKIGTNVLDLQAGTLISLSQALRIKNNHLALSQAPNSVNRLQVYGTQVGNWLRSKWLVRRARQILIENLNDLEDLYIRNTDSLIEYPTFGEVLAQIPTKVLERRIEHERAADNRPEARVYYQAYLAENYLNNYRPATGQNLVRELINSIRPKFDSLLRLHLFLLALSGEDEDSIEYVKLSDQVFLLSRAALRNYGYRLPVNYRPDDPQLVEAFEHSPFRLDNSRELPYSIGYQSQSDEHTFEFFSNQVAGGGVKVRGNEFQETVAKFIEEVFTED